jgi:hypothetical protein
MPDFRPNQIHDFAAMRSPRALKLLGELLFNLADLDNAICRFQGRSRRSREGPFQARVRQPVAEIRSREDRKPFHPATALLAYSDRSAGGATQTAKPPAELLPLPDL